jgi:Esterase PHB depolymerase
VHSLGATSRIRFVMCLGDPVVRFIVISGLLSVAFPAFAVDSTVVISGQKQEVIFTEYSPLSRCVELARRTLSPLANVEIAKANVKAPPLCLQAIDLQRETFFVHVPASRPPRGYGLLVFIHPSKDDHVPSGWAPVLDEHGMIYVSAYRSGNEENILDRRIPLAVLGAYNIMQRYPIDGDRVYIGGFSGGSRVAMRVALAYPDLFRGVLLNAGSDPIGDGGAMLPSTDLFDKFQRSSRVVYITGSEDSWNVQHDMVSRDSLQALCVFGTSAERMFGIGHRIAAASFVDRALTTLDLPPPVDEGKLSACKMRIAKALAADLRSVTELVDRHKLHDARRALIKADLRYGGLAAPDSIELEGRIGDER